jgi:hypothetical protein
MRTVWGSSIRRRCYRDRHGDDHLRPSLSHVPVAVLALALTNLTVDSLKASALFDLLVPPLHVVCLGVVLPQFGTPSTRADFPVLPRRVPSYWRAHCEPVEAMHSVGRCRGVEDVIVAEDFTFAASSGMGDDVTGLGLPTCDAVDALTFSSLGHWRPPRFNAVARGSPRLSVPEYCGRRHENPARVRLKGGVSGTLQGRQLAYGADQCAPHSAWKLVIPESNEPVIAVVASTRRGKSIFIIEAKKIAAIGRAMTK